MKKTTLLPLLIACLLLGGCKTSSRKKTSKGSSIHSETTSHEEDSSSQTTSSSVSSLTTQIPPSSSSSGTSSSSSEIDPPGDDPIEGIMIREPYIKANVDKTSVSATVEYYFAEGVDEKDVDKSVIWHIGNAAIASVDDYGQVTGIARGKTTLTCTSVVGNKSSTVDVYVLNKDEDFQEKLLKITNTEIKPGDDLVIAASEYSVAAGKNDTGSYLHPETISLSTDKSEILDLGDAAMFKVLDDKKGREGLVLEDPDRSGDKFLGVSNVSNVNFYASNNTSQTLWAINWDTSISAWDMRASSATTVDGWMMYNSSAQRFTTYYSNVTASMHLIDIYRMTVIVDL